MSKAVALLTACYPWRRARVNNATDNGFPSKLITATRPSGIGDNVAQATASAVIDFGIDGPMSQNGMMVKPFGAGSNNNTASMRAIGWSRAVAQNNGLDTLVWDPTDLFEVQYTLSSTLVGLAGKILVATDLFADTITLTGTTAIANVNVTINSPANDRPAYLLFDALGFELVEFVFTTGGSATSGNCLWRNI